jgi:hypothetical protein
MTQWVSQSDAAKMLGDLGDPISQPALSQYLKLHGEVPRQAAGPGKAQLVDFAALRQSRETRRGRGPSNASEQPEMPLEAPEIPVPRDPVRNELGDRRAKADLDRAESDARRARVQADEAEGLVINRDTAVHAFRSAAVALNSAFDQGRRAAVEAIRAAKDAREADLAMRAYERAVRAAFASALTDIVAVAAESAAPAAP